MMRIYNAFARTYKDALRAYLGGRYDSKEQFATEVLELCAFAGALYQAYKDDNSVLSVLSE